MLNFPNNVTALKAYGGQKLQQIETMMKRQKERQESMNVRKIEKMLAKLEKEREITTIIQNVFQVRLCGF